MYLISANKIQLKNVDTSNNLNTASKILSVAFKKSKKKIEEKKTHFSYSKVPQKSIQIEKIYLLGAF